ncbi:MAG: HlyD family efflux transporter periplasmic adaptor subunit [Gemmatimonadales bacterium]
MDIVRPKKKKNKAAIYGGAVVGTGAFLWILSTALAPAIPRVDRATIFTDVVRRGTLVIQVRGNGTLVPEQARFIPAVTAGRVERRLVLPGTRVTAATILVELSNPDVQLELLEAERQLSAARAQVVSLGSSLEQSRLNQEGVVATINAQHLQARRDAMAAESLVTRGLMSSSDAATARERAAELATRFRLEERRLVVLSESIGPQMEVQEEQVERLQRIVQFQRQRLASMRVPAGADGVVTELNLEEGQWVQPGQTLARVVDPSRLKAVLRIPEVQARDVAIGQRAVVDLRTDSIVGTVVRVDPAPQGGTIAVDIALEGELPSGARPDLSVDGTIQIDRLENVLYTGRPATGQSGAGVALFRLAPEGNIADRVSVRLGRGSVNAIEIREGLREGDVVILSDMSQFADAERVRLR